MSTLRRVRASLAGRGAAATVALAADAARRRARNVRRGLHDLRFDIVNRVDTRGVIAPGSDDGPWAHAVEYQGVWADAFHQAMAALPVGEQSALTFVDLGCGKGKALLLAAGYEFEQVIGVELSDRLAQTARANAARYARRRPRLTSIEVVHADAARYEFPDRPLLVYMHNPFDEVILAAVVANLEASLRNKPRRALVVYHHALHRRVLDSAPMLHAVTAIPGGVVYEAV